MAPDADGEGPENFHPRLFVSGATPRSSRAVAAARKLREKKLPGHSTLGVIDVRRDPVAARDNQIVAVPALVKTLPMPKRVFIGDMTDTTSLATGLGLAA